MKVLPYPPHTVDSLDTGTVMSTHKKQRWWLPVTPTHSSGSHTEEEGGDLTEPEFADPTKDLESNFIDNIHHNETQIFELQVQTSKAAPLFDNDQDSLLS